MLTRRRRANERDETGSSLILVMVFLTSMGMLSAALLSYELTISKQSFATRRVQVRESGANTGVEWAINSLRQGKDGFCQGGYDRDVITISGREVEVQCRATGPDRAANGVALYLNAAEPIERNAVEFTGETSSPDRPAIVGPIYNGNPKRELGWQPNGKLFVDGDILVADDAGRCEPGVTVEAPSGLVPLYGTAKQCTMPLTAVTPRRVPDPCQDQKSCDRAPLLLDADGKETKGPAACKVFFPGVYKSAPELAGNNYFVPGVYSFVFSGVWKVGSALRGGDPVPDTKVAQSESVLTSIPRCAGAPEPVAPWGVTFVFGNDAALRVLPQGRAELFSSATSAAQLPNVVGGGLDGVSDWSPRSSVDLDRDLVAVDDGEAQFVLHSGVFAPLSSVVLRGGGEAIVMIRNTVVVGRFALASKAGVRGPFGIVGRTGRAKKYLIMANSCPGDSKVVSRLACTSPPGGPLEQALCAVATATVYDDANRTVYVDSWRVDRDPSSADPATCALDPDDPDGAADPSQIQPAREPRNS